MNAAMQYEGLKTTHRPCRAKVSEQPFSLAMGGGQSHLFQRHGPPQLLREVHRALRAGAGLPPEAPQRSWHGGHTRSMFSIRVTREGITYQLSARERSTNLSPTRATR